MLLASCYGREEMRRVVIDRKTFTLRKSGCGKKISVEERSGLRARIVELDVGTSVWVRDCLVSVSRAGQLMGFWRRRRIDLAVVLF